jgi:tRNA A37 threonylcarbamoyladenosine dehydratase
MSYKQDTKRRFGGVERLYGKPALEKFKQSHIVVIGIGGVGSWVIEALARNAIGKLTLIDMDVVAESNINRQLPALSTTLGQNKTDVMAERVREINQDCEVCIIDDFLTQDNITDLIAEDTTYIIDCIDNSRVKSALIAWSKRQKVKILTIGGAGGKIDPSLIKISDLSRTIHDPLLSRTRKLLRQNYNFSTNIKRRFNIQCVYSVEHVKYPNSAGEITQEKTQDELTGLSCAGGIGSSVMVTGSFAFIAVSHVLKRIGQNISK